MVWDIWWNGSNMWWNGLWIHSISSEWPSVVHKLYSYWCFHGSCNILAFCLPSFNSNDRSADKSICIIILMSTSYLKKYHKKHIMKLKAFLCFFRICPVFVDDQWPKISSENRKCIPLHNCHSWFCKRKLIFSAHM